MAADDEETIPLERIATVLDDDSIHVEAGAFDTGAFRENLEAIADAAEALDTLASDAATLRESGLHEQDVVDLLYGRNASLTKTEIESVLGALSQIESGTNRSSLLRRLVADLSGLSQSTTGDVLQDLRRLHNMYSVDRGEK